jgi:hypothetical protein
MMWEALGIGVPIGVSVITFGSWVHSRLSVVETKHESLKATVERIEEKVDNIPEDVVVALRNAGRK